MAVIKAVSARWSMTILGGLAILLGTTWFSTEQTTISKLIVLLGIAALLGFEVGWRKFVDKEFSITEGLSLVAILSLGWMALAGLAGFGVPGVIESNTNILVVLGGILIALEAWVR